MNTQRKYGRTWHYPFSPGTTSDDRINTDYWQDLQAITQLVHTEKLDGEKTALTATACLPAPMPRLRSRHGPIKFANAGNC